MPGNNVPCLFAVLRTACKLFLYSDSQNKASHIDGLYFDKIS